MARRFAAHISTDYLTCPEKQIRDIEAVQTIVDGKVVYERNK